MNWKTIVIVSSLISYLYLLATEWIDLSPWNDVTTSTFSQKLSGSLVNLLPFALLAAAFIFDLRHLKFVAIGLFVYWLLLHFAWWWIPYLWGGASQQHLEAYNRLWSQTYKFLPPRGNNPIPTAQYVTLQALVLLNTILSAVALTKG